MSKNFTYEFERIWIFGYEQLIKDRIISLR